MGVRGRPCEPVAPASGAELTSAQLSVRVTVTGDGEQGDRRGALRAGICLPGAQGRLLLPPDFNGAPICRRPVPPAAPRSGWRRRQEIQQEEEEPRRRLLPPSPDKVSLRVRDDG